MSAYFPYMPPRFQVSHWHGDSMIVRVTKPFHANTSYGPITVPVDFLSDGMSIPRFAWPLVGPTTGRGFAGGLVHDFLYAKASDAHYRDITRAEADEIFLECLYHLGVSWPKRHAMHLAVRSVGWRSYKRR
jgi:hypothetical protein